MNNNIPKDSKCTNLTIRSKIFITRQETTPGDGDFAKQAKGELLPKENFRDNYKLEFEYMS